MAGAKRGQERRKGGEGRRERERNRDIEQTGGHAGRRGWGWGVEMTETYCAQPDRKGGRRKGGEANSDTKRAKRWTCKGGGGGGREKER